MAQSSLSFLGTPPKPQQKPTSRNLGTAGVGVQGGPSIPWNNELGNMPTGKPPPGGSPTGGPNWSLPKWNANVPSPAKGGGGFTSGTPAGLPDYSGAVGGLGKIFSPGQYAEPNTPYARALENGLPVAQFLQNSGQYQADFNEAQRRYNNDAAWGQQTDQYNMGLAGRQQLSAEEQARVAAQQWNSQFGWTQKTDQWGRELSQQELDQRNEYQMGQIGNEAQANSIEQAYRQGLISNEQRNLSLQELTQQQTYGLQQGTLAEQIRAARAQEAIRQQEVSQQMQIAAMQAYGRRVAPNAQWQRSWA